MVTRETSTSANTTGGAAPQKSPELRLRPFAAYLSFIDNVPIGKTALAWQADRCCWEFRWQGRIDGEWYHFVEMVPDHEFVLGREAAEDFGFRLAEKWAYAMQALVGKSRQEISSLPKERAIL